MLNFSLRPIRARNVIATLIGNSKKYKKEKIVIGGHLDSWDLATGAMDNGIGSFTVMDVARVFQSLKLRPKRTIGFVLFMGEEQGLLGSKAMVKKYKDEGKLEQSTTHGKPRHGKQYLKVSMPWGDQNYTNFLMKLAKKSKELDSAYYKYKFKWCPELTL
ncbi:MAG: M20/M25/M40 family metallo-hydrolase [Arcicella sp.]|nr:M20/M25/M40 family metallo-hydrolase [Arcicella sp.]